MSKEFVSFLSSPAGILLIKSDEKEVFATSFAKREGKASPYKPPVLLLAEKQLDEYFNKGRKTFDFPIRLNGTEFQKNAWRALLKIPYGKTVSYKSEALTAGCEKAVRAVANANGKNPLVIVVPCHRVIRSDGSPGGYSAGLFRKKILLDIERGNNKD